VLLSSTNNPRNPRDALYAVRGGNVEELFEVLGLVRGYLSEFEQRDLAQPCHILSKCERVQLAAALAAKARGAEPSTARQPPPAWAATPAMVEAAKEYIDSKHPTYFMLDEMQDTDAVQFELFANLAKFGASGRDARLTVVGDYDQAICA